MSSAPAAAYFLVIVAAFALLLTSLLRGTKGNGGAAIKVTYVLATVFAVFAFIGSVATLVTLLTSDGIDMELPVDISTLVVPSGVTSGPAVLAGGNGPQTVDAYVKGISSTARTMWAIGQTMELLVPATIATLIALACRQLRRGLPFAPVMSRAASITGIAVLIGGLLGTILSDWGASLVSLEVLRGDGEYPGSMFSISIPFLPIGAAFAFGALAAILRFGAALQKDTEGLV